MKNFLRKLVSRRRRSETLIEILVALFSITVGGAAATGLIVSAMQTNASTRDELIALNLAREGIEAVRNIRDTNWLRWSSAPDTCWDLRDASKCFSGPNKFTDDFYRVGIDQGLTTADVASFMWTAEPGTKALNLNLSQTENDFYRLDTIDRFETVDSDGDGDKKNDKDIYAHTTGTKKTPFVTGSDIPSKFYRMVYVSHPSSADPIQAYSIVQWKDRGRVREVELVTTVTNYLDAS